MIAVIIIAIGLVIQFGLGVVTGWHWRQYAAQKSLSDLKAKLLNEIDHITIPITSKKIDNQIFVWNEKTGEFLAQGTNFDDVVKKLEKMYPDKIFTTSTDVLDYE